MADGPAGIPRELIALRVARELRAGMVVNLGIGLPTQVANHLERGVDVLFQAENGILGYGGILDEDFDPDVINAGGQPVALRAGASFFDSASSFAMIRGGHVDVAVLGGLQVSANEVTWRTGRCRSAAAGASAARWTSRSARAG